MFNCEITQIAQFLFEDDGLYVCVCECYAQEMIKEKLENNC